MSVRDGIVELSAGRGRRRAFLGRLLLTPGADVTLDELIDLLWQQPPARAKALLQTYASRVRRLLGIVDPEVAELAARPAGYRLTLRDGCLDVTAFRRLVSAAHADGSPATFEAALGLWRADPCSDVPELADHPLVAGLVDEYLTAVVGYADAAAAVGQAERALPRLRVTTAAHPLHEALHARLVTALAAAGARADALWVYRTVRSRLVDELGIEPGAELRDVHLMVLRDEPVRARHRQDQ